MDDVREQNKRSWDAMADSWFGTTALPAYGCYIPTEERLKLFPDLRGKGVLDVGCGSGHSLKWCGNRGAAELWGLDMSTRQIQNARRFLEESGYAPRLFNGPMEEDCGLPEAYFDVVYSIYAIGWTVDLAATLRRVAAYLKKGGVFIFSWDHPFMHCVEARENQLLFEGCYLEEELFSYRQRGFPVTLRNRKLSTYINALADAGLTVERVVEETDEITLAPPVEFSSDYYSPWKAKRFPCSIVIKAEKR